MNEQIVRKKINKKKPARPRQPIPLFVLKLLEAMGKVKRVVRKASRYAPHQGPRECARRMRQKQKSTSSR